MIDWVGVATNSLWLLGLAICLAVLSYADWNARNVGGRLREVLAQPSFHLTLWSGLTFFCLGVVLSGGRWWERILWGVLVLMSAVEVWQAGRVVFRSAHK